MKNNRQQSPTRQINYQKMMYAELDRVRTMRVSNAAKVKMVAGMMYLLKQTQQLEKVKAQENISTSFSESQSNFTLFQNQIQDLEDRILHKRVIKFQINQEIQGLEEDLFEIEKTVDTKREYDEHLRKSIQCKMKVLEHVEQRQGRNQQTYLNKSMKAVAGFFKGWLI